MRLRWEPGNSGTGRRLFMTLNSSPINMKHGDCTDPFHLISDLVSY